MAPFTLTRFHMYRIKSIIFTGLIMGFLFAGVKSGNAQETDFGAWVALDIKKDITRKFSLELKEEVRVFRDFGEFDRVSTSLSAEYALVKWLKAGVGYAWIYNHKVKSDTWDHRHRYFLFLQGKYKLGRMDVSLRERFQSTFYDEDVSGFEYGHKNYLRSRLQVAYDIPANKTEPYASAEMYYSLNKTGGNEVNAMRYTLGVEFPVSGKLDLDTYLRLDQERNVKNPISLFVAGVNFKLDL